MPSTIETLAKFEPMKVAVVILNWNGKSLLEKFLPKVIAYSDTATIYVADNASTDDSVQFLSENYPEVNIIQNKINGGYAKGYNDALKNLSEDIFILLNSDVAVTPGWITPVISEFEKDPLVAAANQKFWTITIKLILNMPVLRVALSINLVFPIVADGF